MNNNQMILNYSSDAINASQVSGGHRKKRRENFDYNETKLLLKYWGEPQMQLNLKSNYLKTPFIEEIAEKLRMHGFNRSTREVETRLRTMKCSYTRIRKDLDAGWIRNPTWKYFNDVHVILGSSIVTKEQINQQSTEPLDLSTSPTIKPDVNCCTPASKSTTKRPYLKKWYPVPLKIVKQEQTPSQVRVLNTQHTAPHCSTVVNNATSTEQVLSINDNHNVSTEPQNQRTKPILIGTDGLGNKDGTNQVSINEKNIESILQVQQQRFELEKERFGYEKFLGNTILSMCHILIENSKK